MLDIERDSMVGTIAAVLLEERVANAKIRSGRPPRKYSREYLLPSSAS